MENGFPGAWEYIVPRRRGVTDFVAQCVIARVHRRLPYPSFISFDASVPAEIATTKLLQSSATTAAAFFPFASALFTVTETALLSIGTITTELEKKEHLYLL